MEKSEDRNEVQQAIDTVSLILDYLVENKESIPMNKVKELYGYLKTMYFILHEAFFKQELKEKFPEFEA